MDHTAQENRHLVERYLDAVSAKRMDLLTDILTENAENIHPFAPAGFPQSYVGRDQIIEKIGLGMRTRQGHCFDILAFHQTVDPNIAIAQVNGQSTVVETGRPYKQHYIIVFDFDEGRIMRTTEYFNPIILLDANGGSIEALNKIREDTDKVIRV